MKTSWMFVLACVVLAAAGGCCCGGNSCFVDHDPPITAEEIPS